MTPFGMFIGALLLVAQFALPRRLAFLPLLIAACHLGSGEVIGNFTIVRLLILAGLTRAVVTGSFVWTTRQPLDVLFAFFGVAALLSSLAHETRETSPFVFRAGLVFNVCGTYLYARSYLNDGLERYARWLVLVLAPLAIAMCIEQRTGRNPYAALGARHEVSNVREDRVRAQGPFRHAILAGTAGASAIPVTMVLWRRRRRLAIAGLITCFLVTVASASSGPLATLGTGVGALVLWRWRRHLRALQIAAVVGLVGLNFVMARPVWHLMASIDLVGGSTGWHRARLIDSGVAYLGDWWLAGTDHTRHWMPTGVSWSEDQTDITNYYLHLGVIGGLPLMLALVAILFTAFRQLGRRMTALRAAGDPQEYALWCAGAALAAHAVTFISISYFDQMYVLFYCLIGAVPGLTAIPRLQKTAASNPVSSPHEAATGLGAASPAA